MVRTLKTTIANILSEDATVKSNVTAIGSPKKAAAGKEK